jgi:hypothetical protein
MDADMTDRDEKVREALESAKAWLTAVEGDDDKQLRQIGLHQVNIALAALSQPAPPAEPTFREIRPEEVTFGPHRDVPGADEVELRAQIAHHQSILAQEERSINDLVGMAIMAGPIYDHLLRLLDAARAELAEVREAARPFGHLAEDKLRSAHPSWDNTIWWDVRPNGHQITYGDFRRLAAALAKDAT